MNLTPKVLVTGSSGFCGHFIATELEKDPAIHVVTTSRRNAGASNHICHDLNHKLDDHPLLDGVTHIVHCAAHVNEKDASFEVIKFNLQPTLNLIDYANNAGVRRFINLSSIAVYGAIKSDAVFDESIVPKPKSKYGMAKLLSEMALNSGLNAENAVTHLRLGYVLGPSLPDRYFISKIANQLKVDGIVKLVNPNTTFFSFVDIRDIVSMVNVFIHDQTLNGTFNFVSDVNPTLRQLFDELRRYFSDSKSMTNECENKDSEMGVRYSNAKLEKALPQFSFHSFKDSLRLIFGSNLK